MHKFVEAVQTMWPHKESWPKTFCNPLPIGNKLSEIDLRRKPIYYFSRFKKMTLVDGTEFIIDDKNFEKISQALNNDSPKILSVVTYEESGKFIMAGATCESDIDYGTLISRGEKIILINKILFFEPTNYTKSLLRYE